MEEETVLEGWDLHLTIQKLQAPANIRYAVTAKGKGRWILHR
jgi:hypothetical protein